MFWMFGTINRRLAEVFFEKRKTGKIDCLGFCYVKESEYKSQKEKRWIREDTKRLRLTWREQDEKPTIITWDLPWRASRW